jgi:endonuclease YncB( thermonuclease family)
MGGICPAGQNQMSRLSSTRYGGVLPDGMNLNQELVKQGWCWWYRKYAPGDTVLEGLETEAREARRGLSANQQPMPPEEWWKK